MLYSSVNSSDESVFDEEDEDFIKEVSKNVALIVPEIFPLSITIPLSEEHCQFHLAPIYRMPKEMLVKCVNLVESNLEAFYVKHQGLGWKSDKVKEMQEIGLIYIWYTDSKNDVVGFISFMVTYSDEYKVLYLYEIHVSSNYHSMKIGTQLIDKLHELSHHLNNVSSNQYKYRHFSNDGTALTVFSDNIKALQWYYKLGYQLTEDSPRDKVLRSKVIKPDYYLLIRFNDTLANQHT